MTVITRPEVGQRWIHRTTNPGHQHYGRIVTIELVGRDVLRIKGTHQSTWAADLFVKAYTYLYTPEPAEPDPAPPFEQLALDLGDLVVPDYTPAMSIQDRFEAFHAANPWVYRAYERLAGDWVERGNTRVGVKMLTEIIRWQYGRTTTGLVFKVDNSFTSRYARLLLERNPGWVGLFELRELRAS